MDKESIARVLRTKEAARANYDRLSGIYDLLTASSEGPLRRAGVRRLAPAAGESILEIGCGTGASLVEIARAVGETGSVAGIDLSPRMLARAAQRLARAGMQDRVRLIEGDAVAYPFEPECFDAVFMSFTLELFDTPEIPVVLTACHRALRPGGRVCVVALSADGGGAALRLYAWAHARFPVLVDCRPIHPAAALAEAGFTVRDSHRQEMFGLPVEIVLGKRGKGGGAPEVWSPAAQGKKSWSLALS